ncbi:MAG: DUF4330 domain-containing protein [Candidatus Glassbacteria bacterium]|nr:DUF4330 domain-containing protein [Candidatus Glassbacteria bacterium]
MKLIDEKGRLFGLINLLDLAVILGVLAALYVGISSWVAISQPRLQALGIRPAKISSGAPAKVTVKLDNKRYLLSARLHLIPKSFKGKTVLLDGKIPFNVRDSVLFNVPADLQAGTYETVLEAVTMDVFRRQSTYTLPLAKGDFVVSSVVSSAPKQRFKPSYGGQCFWSLEFTSLVLSQGNEGAGLEPGDSLFSMSGLAFTVRSVDPQVPAERLSAVPESRRTQVIASAELTVSADYDRLAEFLENSGSAITVEHLGQEYRIMPAAETSVELDMLFYLKEPDQVSLLDVQSILSGDEELPRAVVKVSYGEADNPWFSRGSVDPGGDVLHAFEVARIRLSCRLAEGGLYFGRSRLEPDRLLRFDVGGTRLTGGILSKSQPELRAVVRVMIEAMPARLVPLLRAGLKVSDSKGSVQAGEIHRVLDIDPLGTPAALSYRSQPGFGREFRRVILDLELNCTVSGGVPRFFNQQIDFGRSLNFALLGQPLNGVVHYAGELRPAGQLVWQSVQVEFRNVPQELVAWVRPGEQEYSLERPPSWKIERIMSNQPAKILYPSPDGRQALLADHPASRDIRCQVSLLVLQAGDDMFYNGNLLKVGSGLSFNARRWSFGAALVAF